MTTPYQPPIEDYAMIGDCRTAALIGRDGSLDWLCWPRFDSGACFARLVGGPEHGLWSIAPAGEVVRTTRRYRGDTLVLETTVETATGTVRLIDFMPMTQTPNSQTGSTIVRLVEGVAGRVAMTMNLVLRWDYGSVVPWVSQHEEHEHARSYVAGPDQAILWSSVDSRGEDMATKADFAVGEGEWARFVLQYVPSHLPPPDPIDARFALTATETYWRKWSDSGRVDGRYAAEVKRSLLTLKALTFAETGGIVAAPTTSLPEQLGGPRNWDYRYCWLRDATITLSALMGSGHYEEAGAWRDWLHRAVAGSPEQTQIMYGVGGERRIPEWTIDWLPGYQGSAPVRVGNAAAGQLQLDVFGEVMNALYQARAGGLDQDKESWPVAIAMLDHLGQIWREPDEGIWETRGGRKHFVFSKVMAWVAFDRGVRTVEEFGFEGPVETWRATRDEIFAAVCEQGFDRERNSFVAVYGGKELDASLLMLPIMGFLPADDPRIAGTVTAIEHDLLRDGFVLRYDNQATGDGLPGGEGAFLACSFWLVIVRAMQGRETEATRLFERLLAIRNDVGLLAEEYDVAARRQVGNFPQAFSHVALIGAATALARGRPATA